MKWRVIAAMGFVLILFAAFAYLYVNTFVRKHQHAVILFVIDGLDLNTLNLARQQLGRNVTSEPDDALIGDARRRVAYRNGLLNLDSFWNVALLNVQAPGRPVPDEGADATALACGQRVDNGYVGPVNGRNGGVGSLLYAAEQAQRATGLVTTSSLVNPAPVAFYSNIQGEPAPYRNAEDLVYANINVVLGGGSRYFLPANAANEEGRPDNRDLFSEAERRGYTILRTRDELNRLSTWRNRQVFGIFAPEDFYFASLQPEGSSQPSLAEMTRAAIAVLNYNINGYFLVIEHGLVARAAEQNLGKLAVNEVAEVDDAIASAVSYAGSDALVLVTNSYSLGALAPPPAADVAETLPPDSPTPLRRIPTAAHAAESSMPPSGPPTWIAGPGGPAATRGQEDWLHEHYALGWFSTNAPGLLEPQPAFRFQTRALPLADPAWLISRGEGSMQLRGLFNNTDVYDIVNEQF